MGYYNKKTIHQTANQLPRSCMETAQQGQDVNRLAPLANLIETSTTEFENHTDIGSLKFSIRKTHYLEPLF